MRRKNALVVIRILRQQKGWMGLENVQFCERSELYLYLHSGLVRKSTKICLFYIWNPYYGLFLRQKYSVYPVEKFLLYLLEGTKTFLTARFGLLGKSNSS